MSETRTKRCSTCHEVKPLDQFGRDRTQKDGLHYRCRSCASVNSSKLYRSDTPAGERRRANARDGSRIFTEKRKNDPEHPYSWTSRECMWRHYRIVCVPGCSANRGYLCREHYNALWSFQDGRCGLCGGLLARGMRPYPSADHWHRDPDGTGPIRGLLHGGKNGCNVRLLNAYEKGRYIQDEVLREACRNYLARPPSARMTGSDFSVTPPPDPKYLITEPQEESRDHRGDIKYLPSFVTGTYYTATSAWTYTSTPVKETQA